MPSCLPFFTLRRRAADNQHDHLPTTSHRNTLLCACEPLPSYGEAAAAAAAAASYRAPPELCSKAMYAMTDVAQTISDAVQGKDKELRELSLKMWSKPEVAWKEVATHALFVEYLQRQDGWTVTPHAHGLKTAFRAEYIHRAESKRPVSADKLPTVGFQSELDALPGIGHACGHNLIAISGVAASLGLAAALRKHDISARIVLIGTPAEEAAGGKRALLKAGAYKGMDACLMLHPAPLDSVGTMLAVQQIAVTYKGHPAHAGAAPWEGINAQDAGVLAYVNISALRQQIPSNQRVHGIIKGHNWVANVIPDECTLIYNTRAQSSSECNALTKRVNNCFEAAATATGCTVDVDIFSAYKDVRNNTNLSDAFVAVAEQQYHRRVTDQAFMASTDFGDVTYALPALHAEYAIELKNPKTDGNHTAGFAEAAKSAEAHQRTLEASISLAIVAARIASDDVYRADTWKQWKEWRRNVVE